MAKQNMEMSSQAEASSSASTAQPSLDMAKQTLGTVAETVNNNKVLIGSIAAGCGTAIFLLATDSGKRMRTGIQHRAEDLYDLMSEQASSGWCRVRDMAQNMLSSSESQVKKTSADIRRAA